MLVEKIEKLQRELAALTASRARGRQRTKAGKKNSPEARARFAAALKTRWALNAKKSAGKAPKAAPFDPDEAGRRMVVQMQAAEGGAWTGGELEVHYGLSPANLHKRRAEHRIVWWRDAKSRFHYPKWQFNAAGALLPGVQEVLRIFRSADEWRVMSYFLGPRHQLDDQRPLDLLRAGEVQKVAAHAHAHWEENTW